MASATETKPKKIRMLIPYAGHRLDENGKRIGDYVLEEKGEYQVGDVGMTQKDYDGFIAAGRGVPID